MSRDQWDQMQTVLFIVVMLCGMAAFLVALISLAQAYGSH